MICFIQADVGFVVVPAMQTRRVDMSMKNNVQYVTRPRTVHTSVVKKSTAAITHACDLMSVRQLIGRSGAGVTSARLRATQAAKLASRSYRWIVSTMMGAYQAGGVVS